MNKLLLLLCLPMLVMADGASIRMMSWNIWGNAQKVPAEREQPIIDVVKRYSPDIIALQEVHPDWHKSRLFTESTDEYETVMEPLGKFPCHVPVMFKKSRWTMVAHGLHLYHTSLDRSKGFTWVLLQDKATGKKVIAASTHFWWKGGPENNYIRTINAKETNDVLTELQKKYDAPVAIGGDYNCWLVSQPMNILKNNGFRSAAEIAPEATQASSHHGNPMKGEDGKFHGKRREKDDIPKTSIDHIMIRGEQVDVKRFVIVLEQDALDASDHSPIFMDFELK
ncbi:MAG: endonuclease/exonuclease/phosphatase family protein [Lentisphaeria bacterium]|nr:endonuclease/exonuclease/phosphatase family protein [Lentisphaeria bacterium]